MTCYDCIHSHVCKHWDKWIEHFPYKDDDHIKAYLDGMSKTLASACFFFSDNGEEV